MSELKLIIQPDEEDIEAAEVLVDGTIGGHTYRFLLDTGAARTSVNFDAYTAGFPSAEAHSSSGVFADGSYDIITVPSITVGPVSRSEFAITRAPEKHHGGRNLIGMDLLKDLRCHFLFDQQRVLIDPDETPENYARQELRLGPRFHPYIMVEFGPHTANAVWDTGAGLTVVDTNFIDQHPALFQPVGQSTGTDSAGAEMETAMFMMAAPRIGGHDFPPQKVASVDLGRINASLEIPMNLIVGYNIMSRAHWLFDFPRRAWAISKLLGEA
jgi:gag-polyprotein putative aspartyl protease